MYSTLPRVKSWPVGILVKHYLRAAGLVLQPLVMPAIVLAILAMAAGSGAFAASSRIVTVAMVLAGLLAVLAAFYMPELVFFPIFVVGFSIIDPNRIPRIIPRVSAVELLILFLVGVAVVKALVDRKDHLIHTPLDAPVLVFFAACLFSFLNAKASAGPDYYGQRFNMLRVLSNYLVFFAVTNTIRTWRQVKILVIGMFVFSTIIAFFMVAQQVIGTSVSIVPGGEKQVTTAGVLGQDFSDVARVSTPASAIVYVMLLPALILYTMPEYLRSPKWPLAIPSALLSLAIAFTFDRNLWIGIALALFILVIATGRKSKKLLLLLLVVVIAATVLPPLLSSHLPRLQNIVQALVLRGSSLWAGNELAFDRSTQWRLKENELATIKIRESPLLGIGPGGPYRQPWWNGDNLTSYVHNAYLYLMMDVGIVGLLPFAWFSIAFLRRGFSAWYDGRDPVRKSLVISLTLSYIAILFSSATSPRLLEQGFILLIGVILGLVEVIIRLDQQALTQPLPQ